MFRRTGTTSTAAALMRAGRLAEATAEIQRSLGTGGLPGGQGLPGMSMPGMSMPGMSMPGMRPSGAGSAASGSAPGTVSRGSFAGPAGSVAYRLYVPTRPQSPAPLLVMLHGGAQDAETFAAATGMDDLAEREGFLVVYPEQSRSANAMGYWNWFRPGDQRRDAGEPSLIAGVMSTVTADHDVDPAAVAVAGFSAGAAMAAVMAAAYPDLLVGAGVHSGLASGAAHDVGSAFAAMRGGASGVPSPGAVPLVTVFGDADTTVDVRNAESVLAAAPSSPRDFETETGREPGGRGWTRRRRRSPDGRLLAEAWTVHGAGHAWSGGRAGGSYTDPTGPDVSTAMVDFFDLRVHGR